MTRKELPIPTILDHEIGRELFDRLRMNTKYAGFFPRGKYDESGDLLEGRFGTGAKQGVMGDIKEITRDRARSWTAIVRFTGDAEWTKCEDTRRLIEIWPDIDRLIFIETFDPSQGKYAKKSEFAGLMPTNKLALYVRL